jgi:hypothetical protein
MNNAGKHFLVFNPWLIRWQRRTPANMATALQTAEVIVRGPWPLLFETLTSNLIMNVTWQTCLHVNASLPVARCEIL